MPWRRAIVHYEHAVDAVAGALVRAAERSIVSDVPVAVFLSGGVDSAALVALLQHVGAEDLVAYTVGLPGDALDESERARMSAERLGVKHVVIDISDDDGRRFLNESREQQDVPSIDGANTYIIARCVRDAGVKVAVSGVGADEMFGGYPSFDDVARFKLLLSAPFRPLGRAASLLPSDLGSKRVSRVVRSLSSGFDSYALFAARRSLDDGYVARLGLELELEDDVAHEAYDHLRDLRRRGALPDGSELQRALHLEQRFYLHDQLLRDTDQFGMASALEIRAPFLDLEVAKVISGIDPRFFRKRSFKGLLIDAVERATNTKLRDLVLAQPKRGFTLPVERWARA